MRVDSVTGHLIKEAKANLNSFETRQAFEGAGLTIWVTRLIPVETGLHVRPL